jgi:hypothetical protein
MPDNEKELAIQIAELRRTIEGGFIALIAQALMSEKAGHLGSTEALNKARHLIAGAKPKN